MAAKIQFSKEDLTDPDRLERVLRQFQSAIQTPASSTQSAASVPSIDALVAQLAPLIAGQLQAPGSSPINLQSLLPSIGFGLLLNAIVLGGGPSGIQSGPLGTLHTLLHGNAGGAPTYAAVDLASEVTGILPIANGGTGSNATPYGTYTPTLSNDANLTASSAFVCQYMRIGTMVTVSGKINVTPTVLATYTQLGVSLPIASNFATAEQCGGTANSLSVNGANQSALAGADTVNHRAVIAFDAVDITAEDMFFVFMYQIV